MSEFKSLFFAIWAGEGFDSFRAGFCCHINVAVVNSDDYEKWACLRPMTPNMLPVVGKVKGLWVNSGAGHLGWTMAMALAEKIAKEI